MRHYYRRHPDPALQLRGQIILLLADGFTWATIIAVLYCSGRTIARWQRRFQNGRVDALLGKTPGRASRRTAELVAEVVGWVTSKLPSDFGFVRSRWCCGTLALLLGRVHGLHVSRETVRRALPSATMVWRRRRPVLKRKDPDRERILQGLRAQLRDLPPDETAVFQDEVDVATNPKLGSMWMPKGQQARVETPGDNTRRQHQALPGRVFELADRPGDRDAGRAPGREAVRGAPRRVAAAAALQEDPRNSGQREVP